MNLLTITSDDFRFHQRTDEEKSIEDKLGIQNRFHDDEEIAEPADEEYEELKYESLNHLSNTIQSSEYLSKADKVSLINDLILALLDFRGSIIEEK